MTNKKDQLLTSFPGLEYLTRISTTWNEYLVDQASATQEVWDEVKNGNFDTKQVAKLWANGVESYYDVMVEATRSNIDANRPIWVHMRYSKATPTPMEHSVMLSRHQPDATTAEGTPFVSMDGSKTPLLKAGDKTKEYEPLNVVNGRKLNVKLNSDAVAGADEGQYMSLISVPNRGTEPPLAVLVLTVSK